MEFSPTRLAALLLVSLMGANSPTVPCHADTVGQIADISVDGPAFFEISLGSHNGLAEGNVIEITRGNRYVGRAIITKVAKSRSVVRQSNRKVVNLKLGDTVTVPKHTAGGDG